MLHLLHSLSSPLITTLFPKRCPICLRILPASQNITICPTCRDKLTFVHQPSCYRCGKPLLDFEEEYCYDCKRHPKSFDRGFAVMLYDKNTKFSMTQFKYHNKREFSDFYIQESLRLYLNIFSTLSIQAILPVPVHEKKKKERGYNQAELLAKTLSHYLSIPAYSSILIRSVYTAPQKELSPKERLNNLSKAFDINPAFQSNCHLLKTVLLIDDIYTTGSTLEACTRVLKKHGVQTVYTLCICIGTGC